MGPRAFASRRHQNSEEYVAYQEQVTNRHLLPLFRHLGIRLDRPIIDVGCGKGGCVIALARQLEREVTGIDISEENIKVAREAAARAGVRASFEVVDILRDPLPDREYGLILLRDVAEHLPDLGKALARIRPSLAPGGYLYATFPPWRGPYAGHQHNATSAVRFMPYLHALAPKTFLRLLRRWEPERGDWLRDEAQIVENRLTRRKFELAVQENGWTVAYRQTWFLRPAFLRMGIPKVPNGLIGRLPFVGESLTTACEYLLEGHQP